ncbi:unnamed protein product [Ranitomeya imitator]|uniref:Cytochrome c oxidase subunit NDUFA4 n=1 Tax=Ranitomeya imitator TaxID=111125 RepID=A0ABN9MDZ2_9NEOB|nr:unnamed protein product [Ranitomeya imitator]
MIASTEAILHPVSCHVFSDYISVIKMHFGTNLPASRFGGRTAHAPAILEDGGAQGEDGRTPGGSRMKVAPVLPPPHVVVPAPSLLYALRVTTSSPEFVWVKKNNPDPWSKKSPNYQYKFYNETIDYKNLKKEGPDF